jgi:hypothetical protein
LGLAGDFAVWYSKISTELLFSSYIEFASVRGDRRLLTRGGLGRLFAILEPPPARWRNGVVGEHITDVESLHGGTVRKAALVRQDRTHGYQVGHLRQARADFSNATGLPISWDSGVEEDAAGDD